MRRLKYMAFVVVAVLVLAEIALRYMGGYKVYSEKVGRGYQTEYGMVSNNVYHTWAPNTKFHSISPDYDYEYAINSLGLREKEIDTLKPDSVFRILVLGASFTEGAGTPYDSTWPRIMENRLLAAGKKVQVINAGTSGCDAFFSYKLYKDRLQQLHPDLIVGSLNSSDFNTFLVRGGFERFTPPGWVTYKPAPWFGSLYRYSHLFRAVMHKIGGYTMPGLFTSKAEYLRTLPDNAKGNAEAYIALKQTAAAQKAAVLVLIYSKTDEMLYPETEIVKHNLNALDTLQNFLQANGVNAVNIARPLQSKYAGAPPQSFSYAHDLHFLPAAYAYMGNMVADSLLARQLVQ